jgi:hypothetical protein
VTTATATRTAHLSSQGRGVAHTMRCATVAKYQRLRNGVGRGNCPDLTECTFDEAVQLIETRCMFECKLCKRMREAEAKRFHTADGVEAFPVKGEPDMWLVRVSRSVWWVIERTHRNASIEDIDLNDYSKNAPWMVSASVTRTFAAEGAILPGWYTQVGTNSGSWPYRRMQDAIKDMLAEIAQHRAEREARWASKGA